MSDFIFGMIWLGFIGVSAIVALAYIEGKNIDLEIAKVYAQVECAPELHEQSAEVGI